MKNKIILLGLLFSITFSSCTDWLDPKPLDSMVLEDFWKTSNDVESVVLAAYEAMTTEGFMQRVIIGGEVRSDNVVKGPNEPSGDNSLKDILNVTIQPDNTFAKWYDFYKVINYCNSVIKYAPGVQELDPDYTDGRLRVHLAEVKALRALVYFYLARLYKEFPFVTEPSIEDTQKFDIPASSGDSVMNVLIDDLLEAEKGAIKTRGNFFTGSYYYQDMRDSKGRINKNAVRAILADVYLWLEQYQECSDVCDRILAEKIDYEDFMIMDQSKLSGSELILVSNKQSTTADMVSNSYIQIFSPASYPPGNSTESIFELQFTERNDGRYAVKDLYGKSEAGRWLSVSSINDWSVFNSSKTDVRQTDSYYTPGATEAPRIIKYVGTRGNGASSPMYVSRTTPTNWIFYRLPDVMLMKAEALLEIGEENIRPAFDLVNEIYKRSNPKVPEGLVFSQYNSLEQMKALVLLERQREFLFEGKRWFDLLRLARREKSTKNVVSNYLSRNYTFDSDIVVSKLSDPDAFYMPIHKDELIVNPSLKQNPYYIKEINDGTGNNNGEDTGNGGQDPAED